jgi:hypothetical protein
MDCECDDIGCPNHPNECYEKARINLRRIDSYDASGVNFCDACADDAIESGLYDEGREVQKR